MTRDLFDTVPARGLGRRASDGGPMTVERIERALRIAARIVQAEGEVAIATFERIEAELRLRREREGRLARILVLAEEPA